MRVLCLAMICVLLLFGCSAQQTMETVEDVYASLPEPARRDMSISLPTDASLGLVNGSKKLYFCDGYEIMVDVLPAGDLNATLLDVTGYPRKALTVMETAVSDLDRYECVWSAAGEGGDVVGRAVILDDGNYHYCLCVIGSADDTGSLQQTWSELLTSFSV